MRGPWAMSLAFSSNSPVVMITTRVITDTEGGRSESSSLIKAESGGLAVDREGRSEPRCRIDQRTKIVARIDLPINVSDDF